MKKKGFTFILLLSLLLAFSVFEITKAEAEKPDPNGKALWKYITSDHPYTNYKIWPGKKEFYKGTHPHGAILRTFVNSEAYETISEKRGSFPNGSIIVKENYSPEKKLMAVTVMYKIKGYNPSANDWFWVKYDSKGGILKEEKVKGCIGCHSSKKDNDYVFTGPIKSKGGYSY